LLALLYIDPSISTDTPCDLQLLRSPQISVAEETERLLFSKYRLL
jgi:hypothetical protein